MRRQSENDMNVRRGEKFAATCFEPPFPSAGLTLRTVAIATAVVGDGGTLSTAGALIDMAAECGGATAGDGPQNLYVRPANPLAVALDENSSCQCGSGRPPPRAAGSSSPPGVTTLSAGASPEDWRWHEGDVAKGGGSGRGDLLGVESFVSITLVTVGGCPCRTPPRWTT